MNWLLRPSILFVISIGLALGAATLVLWPSTPDERAIPLPLEAEDREIVWLYAATNSDPWGRFVTAVTRAVNRIGVDHPELLVRLDVNGAFPKQSTAVPELVVSAQGVKGKLRFRWYKLTSDLKTEDWVKELSRGRPPPLAILGGGTSDLGIDLAQALQKEAALQSPGSSSPLLLLTTSTADEEPTAHAPLNGIYPKHTFRFCFTNRQMAEAVTSFLGSRAELRPDPGPLYLTYWEDDPYSKDLSERFVLTLQGPVLHDAFELGQAARLCGHAFTGAGTAGFPLDMSLFVSQRPGISLPHSEKILYSVGSFARANRWEVDAARTLMRAKLDNHPDQRRPLLVVPAQTQPARRFLRALMRTAPSEAISFVVATGDAISFNTVYRDRMTDWPIQDMPFSLIFFCHRNPIDKSAGFVEETSAQAGTEKADATAGTEDLLLFIDIADALIQSCYACFGKAEREPFPRTPEELASTMRLARWPASGEHVAFSGDGIRLFEEDGNRRSGTGEHVVYLRPTFRGKEILPDAVIEVAAWQAEGKTGPRTWQSRGTLRVRYEGSVPEDRAEP